VLGMRQAFPCVLPPPFAAGGGLNSGAATRDTLFVHSRTMHGGQWRKCNYCDRKWGFHASSGLRWADQSEGFVR